MPAPPPPPLHWQAPVPGPVVRAFSYGADPFARGWHRGVDLRAGPGTAVRAACGGRVVTALPGAVVTLRCGPWRVTHLPLAGVSVHLGQRVAAGARVGRLGVSRDHRGLHLGVRRAGDPFGYVDPLPFLQARPPSSIPPLAAAPRRVRPPRSAPAPRFVRPPRAAPAPVRASRARPVGVRVSPAGGPAPWPVWLGLVLALCGACGGGVRWRLRARRVAARAPVREAVR
jgi:Peptidase family M23